jgi:putative peptide zinc metalloprotease protein
VVGSAHVVAPQNVSAAVSYNCLQCLTAAIAIQLVVTVPDRLDATTAAKLAALWAEIQKFIQHLGSLTLSQIRERLHQYEQEILQLVAPAAASSSSGAAPAGSSAGLAGSAAPSAAASVTDAAASSNGASATNSTDSGTAAASSTDSASTPAASSSTPSPVASTP